MVLYVKTLIDPYEEALPPLPLSWKRREVFLAERWGGAIHVLQMVEPNGREEAAPAAIVAVTVADAEEEISLLLIFSVSDPNTRRRLPKVISMIVFPAILILFVIFMQDSYVVSWVYLLRFRKTFYARYVTVSILFIES
ncbi:unnamed protein product [Spirodela intermedia]|uniref:Uncharacterized protein n=1 Tax=Spirodela intermedia TaxID=51605 RepID=A0A7I8JIL7_SPIIN|nr:unnamed protein product [Spirodela intermedia]CAA6670004.1 unnamed protein product [Spirodela intermedia]